MQNDAFQPFPRYAVGEIPAEYLPARSLIPDDQIGWRMGNTESGFRTPQLDSSDSQMRVILLGDSFTWGSGVEYADTYGSIVDAKLPDVTVQNLALPGFGVDQMWLTLRHKALLLEPDLIVVGICDADFKRSLTAYRPPGLFKPVFKLVDDELVRKSETDRMSQPFRFLERHSRIWMGGRLVKRWIGYHLPYGEWWHTNRAILDEMRGDAAEHGVPILFIYIPTVAWRPFPMLGEYMRRVEAHYIDLRQDAPDDFRALYGFGRNPHFNRAGHQFVASKLLEWMESHHLITASAPSEE